jgi:hypothetical protein
MGITDFLAFLSRVLPRAREAHMAKKLTLVFLMVMVAAFVAINSRAAVPKHESAAPIVAKGAIYRADLWKVY